MFFLFFVKKNLLFLRKMDILTKLKVYKVSKVENYWVIQSLFLILRTFDFTDLIYSIFFLCYTLSKTT